MSAAPIASVVRSRVTLERDRLARGRRGMLSVALGDPWPDDAVVTRLTALFDRTDVRLTAITAELAKGTSGERVLTLLRDTQRAVDRVLAESLQITLGALARGAGIDDGACEEADRFVRHLAGRLDPAFARPTVPGGSEFVHRAADVVRRRVPDHGVWDLPVMAHEFGHLVVAGLQPYDAVTDQVSRPVEDRLSTKQGMERSRAEELFCDMFATFATGPAYPCALVFHRLDPMDPAEPATASTHPSDAQRVHACLWTLAKMRGTPAAVADPYDPFIKGLDGAWTLLQQDAPVSSRLTGDQARQLTVTMSSFWTVLTQSLPTMSTTWAARIAQVTTCLRGGTTPPPDLEPAEILNAAWRLRMRAWTGVGTVPAGFDETVRSMVRASLGMEGATWLSIPS